MQSLDQQRAAHAWTAVSRAKEAGVDLEGVALNAPALVMGNGLMQTLAFLRDKGKAKDEKKKPEKHEVLRAALTEWIRFTLGIAPYASGQEQDPLNLISARMKKLDSDTERFNKNCKDSFESVMQALLKADTDDYMRATEEALEWLKWARHFAKALGG